MALTFYYGSGSPYSWRVLLGLEHKKVPYELRVISFAKGDLKTPEFAAINPRQLVPAVVDDGFALSESNAIVEYLDDRFPGEHPLLPRELRARATARRVIAEVDGYLGVAVEHLVREIFFKANEKDRDRALIAKARADIVAELGRSELSMTGDFVAGPLGAADYALYPFLAMFHRFEIREPELALSNAIPPKISAWKKRIEALSYYDKTYPPHWRS